MFKRQIKSWGGSKTRKGGPSKKQVVWRAIGLAKEDLRVKWGNIGEIKRKVSVEWKPERVLEQELERKRIECFRIFKTLFMERRHKKWSIGENSGRFSLGGIRCRLDSLAYFNLEHVAYYFVVVALVDIIVMSCVDECWLERYGQSGSKLCGWVEKERYELELERSRHVMSFDDKLF